MSPTSTTRRDRVIVNDLSRTFGSRTVLQNLDLRVEQGEFVSLLGPSGCGKTTLLKILARLDAPDSGQVEVPTDVAVVFQEHRLIPWRRVRVNVGLAAQSDRASAVATALAEVGLADHANAWPSELSGGQAQRVAIARALVSSPDLLLLDEPFASLDALTRVRMQELIRELHDKHSATTLLVTHDVDEAIALSDRVVVMSAGKIAADIDTSSFHGTSARGEPYETTRNLLLHHLGITAHHHPSN